MSIEEEIRGKNLALLDQEVRAKARALEEAEARARRILWIEDAMKCGDAIDRCLWGQELPPLPAWRVARRAVGRRRSRSASRPPPGRGEVLRPRLDGVRQSRGGAHQTGVSRHGGNGGCSSSGRSRSQTRARRVSRSPSSGPGRRGS